MKTRTGYKCDYCERPLDKTRCEADNYKLHFCNNNCKKLYTNEPVMVYIARSVGECYVSANWPPE